MMRFQKMSKTINEIKKAIPDIESEKVEAYADELDRVLALKALVDTPGGKEILKIVKNNCFIALRKLIKQAKENPTIDQLLATIMDYSANISLIAELQDINTEEELRRQLDEAVKEAYRIN